MLFDQVDALAARHVPKSCNESSLLPPNLHIIQKTAESAFETIVYELVICLILRGAKETVIGTVAVSLRRGDALLVSHDIPVSSKITQASVNAPYRCLVLTLDLSTIRSLYEQVGDVVSEVPQARSMMVSAAQMEWVEPLGRYLDLVDNYIEQQVLGPMLLREIHFRLLMSPIGGMLRNLLVVDSHASRIARVIANMRKNFREPMVVTDLAELAGMSQSSFHEHFKSVTGTTPLQYQKELRLIEAQALLRDGGRSVSMAGFDVGYESPTHFSRDYSRKFGCPPKNHLAQTA